MSMGKMPVWGWFFMVACAAIPIAALGGAIPAAIGAGGAAGCYSVARNESNSAGTRAAICAGITVVCWVLFLVIAGGTIALFNM